MSALCIKQHCKTIFLSIPTSLNDISIDAMQRIAREKNQKITRQKRRREADERATPTRGGDGFSGSTSLFRKREVEIIDRIARFHRHWSDPKDGE